MLIVFGSTFECDSAKYDKYREKFEIEKPKNLDEYNNRLALYCEKLKNI